MLWLRGRAASGTVANVYQDGVCVLSFDLSQVAEARTYVLEDPSGSNTILVEPGRIRVLEADCPDQICVQAGWLTDSAAPIVCLPHRLVIRLENTAGSQPQMDAVSQ